MIELHKHNSDLVKHAEQYGGDWGFYEMVISDSCIKTSILEKECDENVDKLVEVMLIRFSIDEYYVAFPYTYTYINDKLILIRDEFNYETGLTKHNIKPRFKRKIVKLAQPYFTSPGMIEFPVDPKNPNSQLKKYKHYWGDLVTNGKSDLIIKYFNDGRSPQVDLSIK